MSRRALVHPRFLERLSQFYPSRCTIESSAETVSGVGTRTLTWTAVAGLANVPCALAPVSTSETRGPAMTYSTQTHVCSLQGHFSTITSVMRAVVDGNAFDIVGVEHDSRRQTTRLSLKVVEV